MKTTHTLYFVKTEKLAPQERRYQAELTKREVAKIFDDDPTLNVEKVMADIDAGIVTESQIQEHVAKRGFDLSKLFVLWDEGEVVSGGEIIEKQIKLVGESRSKKHGVRFLRTEEGRGCFTLSEAFLDEEVLTKIYQDDPKTGPERIAKMMRDVESGSFTAERIEAAMDRQSIRIKDVVDDWSWVEGAGEPQGDHPRITYQIEDCELQEE